MAKYPWFRLYSNDLLNDRKLTRIARVCQIPMCTVRGLWLTLLAMANDSPDRGCLLIAEDIPVTEDEIRFDCGLDEQTFGALMAEMDKLGMIDRETCVTVSKFLDRNPPSDSSTMRVKRYRERRKESGLPSTGAYSTAEIVKRDGGKCVYCESTENLCVDHVLPIQLGGTDDPRNLACACKRCNSGKAGRTPEQAGYRIQNPQVYRRYCEYIDSVTVTETGSHRVSNGIESESESYSESESESEAPTNGPHPAFEVYETITGRLLSSKIQMDDIIKYIPRDDTSISRWAETIKAGIAMGWKEHNVVWMTDHFRRGSIPGQDYTTVPRGPLDPVPKQEPVIVSSKVWNSLPGVE